MSVGKPAACPLPAAYLPARCARGVRAAGRCPPTAGTPRSSRRPRRRHRASSRPGQAEDLGGPGADVLEQPQVEGEAHGLPVALTEQRLDVCGKAHRLIRRGQRGGCDVRFGAARGRRSQQVTWAPVPAGHRKLRRGRPGLGQCQHGPRGPFQAGGQHRTETRIGRQRSLVRRGRQQRDPPGALLFGERPEVAAMAARRTSPSLSPGPPAPRPASRPAAAAGPAQRPQAAARASRRRARAFRRKACSSGSARAARRPTRTATAGIPRRVPGRRSRRTSACRCRTACSVTGRTGIARSAPAMRPRHGARPHRPHRSA